MNEETQELFKVAAADDSTYLQKVANIVDVFAGGHISGDDADAVATQVGVEPADLLAMYKAVYGEPEDEMEKTAEAIAHEAEEELLKVAQDEDASYLTKCASIADAFAAGAISAEDGDEIATGLGLDPDDVAAVYQAA